MRDLFNKRAGFTALFFALPALLMLAFCLAALTGCGEDHADTPAAALAPAEQALAKGDIALCGDRPGTGCSK